MYFSIKCLLFLLALFPFCLNLDIGGVDDSDWHWDLEEDEDGQETDGDLEDKPKRWTKQGLCDHDPLTSLILKLILDVQSNMHSPDNLTGFPTLDPLYIPKMNMFLKGKKHDYAVKVNLTNTAVKNLSNSKITNIQTDLDSLYINVSAKLDSMSIRGNYIMNGKGKASILTIPISGNGVFILKPKDVTFQIFTKFGWDNNGTLVLEELDYALGLKDLQVELTGFMFLGRRMNILFSRLVTSIGLKLFNKLEPRIHERLRTRGIREVNRLLVEMETSIEILEDMLNHSVYCMFG